MDAKTLIHSYFTAFNAGRTDDMLALLHDEIEHHVNEGQIRRGKALFASPDDAALPPSLAFFADRPLPINRADVHTLTLLPGIGPRLAEAISSERQRLGAFAGPDDLERVAGIGPATVQRLRPLVSFK